MFGSNGNKSANLTSSLRAKGILIGLTAKTVNMPGSRKMGKVLPMQQTALITKESRSGPHYMMRTIIRGFTGPHARCEAG